MIPIATNGHQDMLIVDSFLTVDSTSAEFFTIGKSDRSVSTDRNKMQF